MKVTSHLHTPFVILLSPPFCSSMFLGVEDIGKLQDILRGRETITLIHFVWGIERLHVTSSTDQIPEI